MSATSWTVPGRGLSIEEAATVTAPPRCTARWAPACAAVDGGALLTLPASILAGQCCCCRNDHGTAGVGAHT